MALLKRSLKDGHLYLRGAGIGRRGTWQIGQEGEDWLLRQGYSLPDYGYGIHLSQAVIMRLDQYLHILGLGRSSKRYVRNETSCRREQTGLPLLLRLMGMPAPVPPWILRIELAKLVEMVPKDRPSGRKPLSGAIVHGTLSSSPSTLNMPQLLDVSFWPQVVPQREPYQIFWLDKQGRQHDFPATVGLQEGWQGNIFVSTKGDQSPETWWRRCLPSASISASDCKKFYWLAEPGYDPEWPGSALQVREEPFRGWQLWQLGIDSTSPLFWEEIEQWLSDRGIDLVYPTWRLRVLNPFSLATEDQYIIPPDQPLLVQCYPPQGQPDVLPEKVRLVVVPIERNTDSQHPRQFTPVGSAFLQPDQEFYFNLQGSIEAYDVRLSGEARGDFLRVKVAPTTAKLPVWLDGLKCSIKGKRNRRILYAFSHQLLDDQPVEIRIPEDFSAEEMLDLNWVLEPVGIPFSWAWQDDLLQKPCREPLLTGSDLSLLWRELIWPSIENNQRTEMVLDAGSFGRIAFTLVRTPVSQPDRMWWQDKQLSSQFIWLSCLSKVEISGQVKRPVPTDLRQWLLQAGQITEAPLALSTALEQLAALECAPIWMLVRLQTMLARIQKEYVSDQVIGR